MSASYVSSASTGHAERSMVACAATAPFDGALVIGAMQPLTLGASSAPPEWVTLIPAGTFSTNDGRGPFHNPDPDQVIARTRARLGGREAPADYDHLSEYVEQTGQPAKAAGWIKDWRVVDGAIQARVEWTAAATAAISAKEYRYVSPVFSTDDKDPKGNVVSIRGFALVNRPARDLPAIAAAHRQTEESTVSLHKIIAQALGLAETVSEAELVAAVTTTKKNFDGVVTASGLTAGVSAETIVVALRDKPDAAKWIAASEHQATTAALATITAERDTLLTKAAGLDTETVIAAALKEGKLVPAQKAYWTQICAAAKSSDPLVEYLKTAPVVVELGTETGTKKPPAAAHQEGTVVTAAELNAAEKAHCKKFGLSHEGYANSVTQLGYRPLAA